MLRESVSEVDFLCIKGDAGYKFCCLSGLILSLLPRSEDLHIAVSYGFLREVVRRGVCGFLDMYL